MKARDPTDVAITQPYLKVSFASFKRAFGDAHYYSAGDVIFTIQIHTCYRVKYSHKIYYILTSCTLCRTSTKQGDVLEWYPKNRMMCTVIQCKGFTQDILYTDIIHPM